MPLPTTGAISFSAVAAEIGRAAGSAISLGETAVRNLAGVATGAISLSQLYGKSSVTFSPVGGASSASPVYLSDWRSGGGAAQVTIFCSQAAVWVHSRSGTYGAASVASGGSATSITFSLANNGYTVRESTWTVSGTVGGVTQYWQVTLTNDGLA